MYNSEKVCNVKYGTIQGFKHLVRHFKEASIMRVSIPPHSRMTATSPTSAKTSPT